MGLGGPLCPTPWAKGAIWVGNGGLRTPCLTFPAFLDSSYDSDFRPTTWRNVTTKFNLPGQRGPVPAPFALQFLSQYSNCH